MLGVASGWTWSRMTALRAEDLGSEGRGSDPRGAQLERQGL